MVEVLRFLVPALLIGRFPAPGTRKNLAFADETAHSF